MPLELRPWCGHLRCGYVETPGTPQPRSERGLKEDHAAQRQKNVTVLRWCE